MNNKAPCKNVQRIFSKIKISKVIFSKEIIFQEVFSNVHLSKGIFFQQNICPRICQFEKLFPKESFSNNFFSKGIFFQKSGEIKNFFPTTFSPAEIISKGIFSDRNSFQRYKSPKIGNFFQKFLFKCEFFSKEKPYMGTLFQALSLEQLTV